MITYRHLTAEEIDRPLFAAFIRRQIVTDCLRWVDGGWTVQSAPFIDDWSEQDYVFLITCLRGTIANGGVVFAAFNDGVLKGFCSVEGQLFGRKSEYLDLSSLHVSADLRGQGVGTALFRLAAEWAKAHGGEKLYISSHSAVETQAFYGKMGCVDAVEHNTLHTEQEPFDRQLECLL